MVGEEGRQVGRRWMNESETRDKAKLTGFIAAD